MRGAKRYLIRSEQGWLGGLSFSSAAWRLGVRDEWIGWSEATRGARLSRIALNSRFLILPSVQVPHLASHVLGLAGVAASAAHQAHARAGRLGRRRIRPLPPECAADQTAADNGC